MEIFTNKEVIAMSEIAMEAAWDPDFTKTTPDEAERIAQAEKSGFIDDEDIDWEKIGK